MKALIAKIAGLFDLRDAFVFGGLFTLGYGAYLMYQPAGFMIVGAGLFWLGVRK